MSTATIDLTAHPAPRTGGFTATIARIELRRILRNKRTMLFTLVFPVVMFLFIASQVTGKEDQMGTAYANVGAFIW